MLLVILPSYRIFLQCSERLTSLSEWNLKWLCSILGGDKEILLILVLSINNDVCQHCILSSFLSSVKKITGILLERDSKPRPLQIESSVLPTKPPRLPSSQRQYESYTQQRLPKRFNRWKWNLHRITIIKNNNFGFYPNQRCVLALYTQYFPINVLRFVVSFSLGETLSKGRNVRPLTIDYFIHQVILVCKQLQQRILFSHYFFLE